MQAFRQGFLFLSLLSILSACSDSSGDSFFVRRQGGALSDLAVSSGTLEPGFDPNTRTYTLGPGLAVMSITVTATAADPGSTITVNGNPVTSGVPSVPIAIISGMDLVTVEVTPPTGPPQVYTILIVWGGPQAQEAYLKASNTEEDDWFGASIAISGDTIVVGAPQEDSTATGVNGNQADNGAGSSGAAYIFTRSAGSWTQQAYLKASNPEIGDAFGHSVAISGDTIVVGAYLEDSSDPGVNGNQADNGAPSSGAAYVFTRTGGSWTQQAYLKASNPGFTDQFGYSVDISGDTIVVGANYERSNATGVDGNQADDSLNWAGAAYVFTRTAGVWSQQAYLKASNTELGDYFGCSVALSGDTVVVGAFGEDSNATGVDGNQADNSASQSGAAYVFTRTGGTWTQDAYLKASNTDDTDSFGRSLSISGDTVVVGALGEASKATGVNGDQADNSEGSAGAVYVFTRPGGTWTQEAYLKASNAEGFDRFGTSVSIDGNALVVGAWLEYSSATGVNGNQSDNGAGFAGAAYFFTRNGGVWRQDAYLKASNTESYDQFGYSAAISGDTVAVGASGSLGGGGEDSGATGVNGDETDNSAENSGAAYVFR